MLLGSEFQLLSMIAKEYSIDRDKIFRLNEKKFREDFNSNRELLKLQLLGLAVNNNGQIHINGVDWINLFVRKLNENILLLGYSISCYYDASKEKLVLSSGSLTIEFKIKFYEDLQDNKSDTIYFCYINSFDFHLFWLDLLNDSNLLEMFCMYIKNEITKLELDNIYRFSFFEGLPPEYLSEIFNVSIKDYLNNEDFVVSDLPEELLRKIHKFIRKDNFDFYNVRIFNSNVIVVKYDGTIEFLQMTDDELVYTSEVKQVLDKLKSILLSKISTYRQLSLLNNNKAIANVKSVISIATVLISAFNGVLLYAISKGLPAILGIVTNHFVIWTVLFVQLIASLATLWWVAIPAARMSFFKWKLN